MKNGQKSSLYGEVSPYSEEIPYSERFSQIHYREYPLYYEIKGFHHPQCLEQKMKGFL